MKFDEMLQSIFDAIKHRNSPSYNSQQYLSLVFTRKDDKWFLVNDQTTPVL